MFTRMVASITLGAFLLCILSCTHVVDRYPSEEVGHSDKIIAVVLLPDAAQIIFDEFGGRYLQEKKVVVGVTREGKSVEIALKDIMYLQIKKIDEFGTVLLIVGTAIAAGLVTLALVAALKESCPFIYSYDGSRYIFDAEPLGGAICPGMKRSELSRLDHLKVVDGEYRIMVRNEVDEIQHLDHLKLLVFDHSPTISLIADSSNNVYGFSEKVGPLAAIDENGNRLCKFFRETDNFLWLSHMPLDTVWDEEILRHEITCKFLKPPDAKKATLMANAGATLWGSRMIKEMLMLRGDKVDDWYRGVAEAAPELTIMKGFQQREELYLLKINVKHEDHWDGHGYIHSGGPLMIEDRALPIDIHGIPGDTLTLRFNPPVGFWKIDCLNVTYDEFPVPEPVEVGISTAINHRGNDVSDILIFEDSAYHVMPDIGDWIKVAFEVPPQSEGTERTIFLYSEGYYDIHLDRDQPPQTDLIAYLGMNPGEIVKYSMKRYLEWVSTVYAGE